MYHHVKKLMYTVEVGTPDPRFGAMLLEQFGGANGELAAAMQYSIQGLNCEDPKRKDLLMDIGTEELSHLEVIGVLARAHLKPLKEKGEAAEQDPLIAVVGGRRRVAEQLAGESVDGGLPEDLRPARGRSAVEHGGGVACEDHVRAAAGAYG